MKIDLRPRRARTRLTLWYVGVLGAVLALYVASTLLFVRLSLREELDLRVGEAFERVEDLLGEGPAGAIRMGGHGDAREGSGLVEVWSTDGTVLYRSEGLAGEDLGSPRDPGGSFASLALESGAPLRVLTHPVRLGDRSVLVRVALSEDDVRHEWRELMYGLLVGLPVAIAIAALGGHWLAGRVLGPLGRMAQHAARLASENLGERLPVENPDDELGHLAQAFNGSLARIEESFSQLRRFTADASHELRTPLTAIRTVGEVALQDPRNLEGHKEAIGSMLEEADRLSRLVGSLLFLSRADAGPALHREPVGLLGLARESVALLEILADEKGQRIEVLGDAGVSAHADALILRQALINLIDNAIKYSPRDSGVRIEVSSDDGAAVIDVVDRGPGIPGADQARVFERFYRVDEARSRGHGGAGLGLSIALWAVRAHGGRIDLRSVAGEGSTFRIVLPGGGA